MSFVRKIKVNGRIYLAEVENIRLGKKIKQKVIKYIGRQPDNTKNIFPNHVNELIFDSSKIYGSVFVLDFIAKKIGLYELLGEHAPAILTLVYCHYHDYNSIREVHEWFHRTDLRKIFGIPNLTEEILYKALSAIEKLDSLGVQKKIFENIMNFCDEKISSIIYDVTNTYFTGKASGIAKMGKDKEGVRGRRIIQIGLVITKNHGLPIFHQTHPGNIHDAKIFSEAIIF